MDEFLVPKSSIPSLIQEINIIAEAVAYAYVNIKALGSDMQKH